jgi:hypothetical protein
MVKANHVMALPSMDVICPSQVMVNWRMSLLGTGIFSTPITVRAWSSGQAAPIFLRLFVNIPDYFFSKIFSA